MVHLICLQGERRRRGYLASMRLTREAARLRRDSPYVDACTSKQMRGHHESTTLGQFKHKSRRLPGTTNSAKTKPLLQPAGKPAKLMKRGFASIGGSVSPMTLCGRTCASTEAPPRRPKIRLINVVFLRTLSEIKLKRTDTTLDLSQKAKRAGEEKKKGKGAGDARYLCLRRVARAPLVATSVAYSG
jgi:hypothetical protein